MNAKGVSVWLGGVVIALVGFVAGRLTAPKTGESEQGAGGLASGGNPPSAVSSESKPKPRKSELMDLPVAVETQNALALRDDAKPGEVNWKLIDQMRETLYQRHPAVRLRQFQILMGVMRPIDAPAVRELFNEADRRGVYFSAEWKPFWSRWGEVDGPAAMAEVTKKEQSNLRNTVAHAASGWASKDPQAAFLWLSEWGQNEYYWDTVYTAMVGGFAVHDLTGATDVALKIAGEKPITLDSAMGQLADAAILQGVEGMTAWLKSLPSDDALRERAFGHAHYRVKRTGNDSLADWLGTLAGESIVAIRTTRHLRVNSRATT